MGEGSESGIVLRYPRVVVSLLITLALVGCGGLGLLPYHDDTARAGGFGSLRALKGAYREIRPGSTLASDLAGLGFDAARAPNVQVLSYLGVMERFMPRDSLHFDRLAPAVQSCIDARDRCTAYVFHSQGAALSNLLMSGEAKAWSAQVTLLVQDGRVAYKALSEAVGRRKTSKGS